MSDMGHGVENGLPAEVLYPRPEREPNRHLNRRLRDGRRGVVGYQNQAAMRAAGALTMTAPSEGFE